MRSQVVGEPADGRRQHRAHDLRSIAGTEQVEDYGGLEEVHRSGQSRGGEDRRSELSGAM